MSSSSFLYNGEIYEIGEDNILRSGGVPYISISPDGTFQFAGNVGDVRSSFVSALANDTQLQQNILTAYGKVQSNVATTDSNPDSQSGSEAIQESDTSTGESSGLLFYPNDLSSTEQDIVTFQAHSYESGGRVDVGSGWGVLNPVKFTPLDPIIALPIQSSITDQNSVGWESDTMNPIEIQAARISRSAMNPESDVTNIATEAIQGALVKAKQHGEGVLTYLVGQAIGVNNLQSRLLGQVLNPNLELLFQGPQLRPFNFTFKLSPRSSGEAKTVKEIINYFKKNMAVKRGEDAIFLKAPNVFKIRYQYKSDAHPGLNLIKMCALTNCSVDYTPLGSYATYSDGTMVAYTMTLSFQELTPIYDTDYTEGFDYGDGQDKVVNHPIGA